jgi:CheY-like chemotaxis protein
MFLHSWRAHAGNIPLTAYSESLLAGDIRLSRHFVSSAESGRVEHAAFGAVTFLCKPTQGAASVETSRILVVDDEWIIRALIAQSLRDAGYDVAEAENGDTAARLLDVDQFNVLVTDIHMPGQLDGIALAERVRRQMPNLWVVFVTGRPDVIRRVIDGGLGDAVLSKPFQPEEVVQVVHQLLGPDEASH